MTCGCPWSCSAFSFGAGDTSITRCGGREARGETAEKIGDALAAQMGPAHALAAYQAGLASARRARASDPENAEWNERAASLARKVAREGR